MEKLRNRLGSTRIMVISGLVYLVSQAAIGAILQPIGFGSVMRMQITVSDAALSSIFSDWFQRGIAKFYLQHFYLDFLHPVWYSVFLASCMSKILNVRSFGPRWSILLLLPFTAAALDIVENVMHLIFLYDPANISCTLAHLSGFSSITKWALAAFCTLFVFIYAAKIMSERGRSRKL